MGKTAIGLGAAAMAYYLPVDIYSGYSPVSVKMPLGFQVWTIKDMLIKDFPGTLKKIKELGYQSVEMCLKLTLTIQSSVISLYKTVLFIGNNATFNGSVV